jgi:hypothetical protein
MLTDKARMAALAGASAAGMTEVDSGSVDAQRTEGVLFMATLGAISANGVAQLNIQESSTGTGGWAAIPGATATFTDSGAGTAGPIVVAVDVFKPQQRYLRAQLLRTVANTVLDGIVSMSYGLGKPPAIQDSTVTLTKVAPVS